jgi:antibiotic biosynthesis monooxygenase (ABM) superfamily enzyme
MRNNIQHKRAFLTWLAIYPLITMLFGLLGDDLSQYPLAVRTFILTAIAVPIVFYLILPFYNSVFTKWLNQ